MEQSIINTNVTILEYCKYNFEWKELGSVNGECSLTLYRSNMNTYRFVAHKILNNEIVLNAFLFPSMHYNETSPTFHQWIDNSFSVYGLNFTDSSEAKRFSSIVGFALQSLNSAQSTEMNYSSTKSLPRKKNVKICPPELHLEKGYSYSNCEISNFKDNLSWQLSFDSKPHLKAKSKSFCIEPHEVILNTSSALQVKKNLKGREEKSSNPTQILAKDIYEKTNPPVNLLADINGKYNNKYFEIYRPKN